MIIYVVAAKIWFFKSVRFYWAILYNGDDRSVRLKAMNTDQNVMRLVIYDM